MALQPAEIEALRLRSIPVSQRADGAPVLALRCAALDDHGCSVYADRPAPCRAYRCLLYIALGEGEVSLQEALEVVKGAHAHLRAVEEALPPAKVGEPRSALQRARRAHHPAHGGPLPPAAHHARERAEAYLDRHLRGRSRRG